MQSLATLLGGILVALRAGINLQAGRGGVHSAMLYLLHNRISGMASRLARLFARYQAGTLPSQTGAKPRPSRAGLATPQRARMRLPTGHCWLLRLAQPPAATAASQLQNWMTNPEFRPFLAAAPQAGRILRPLCRMLGIAASPSAPTELNLPKPPRFRPAPPPPPITLGIIDPPEVQPLYLSLPRNRAGRAWYE